MAQAGNMFPRYYENVHRRLGVDVAKRQQLIVLVGQGRGDLPRGYLAEDAIARCLHPLYCAFYDSLDKTFMSLGDPHSRHGSGLRSQALGFGSSARNNPNIVAG